MLPELTRPALLAAALLSSGCGFFFPEPEPPPDPQLDGRLTCDSTELVTGLDGVLLPVEVPAGQSFEIHPQLGDPGHTARVEVESGAGLVRLLPVWDPISQRGVVTGQRRTSEETLALEFLTGGAPLEGSVSMVCSSPAESCFDLTDNDGDDRVDCADLHCARDPGCEGDQGDLETVDMDCDQVLRTEQLPVLGAINDQRTLYSLDADDAFPLEISFWGGPEIAVTEVEADGELEVTFGGPGMVCAGEADGSLLSCAESWIVDDGDSLVLETDVLPLRLEPLGTAWAGLELTLHCD